MLLGCQAGLLNRSTWYQMHDVQVELLPKLKFQCAFYEY